MPSYNHATFIGNVTRDPELKFLPSQKAICDFGIAVNSWYKDKQDTLFMDCTAFDKTAETISKYVKKGNSVFVCGRIKQDNWDDKTTGQKRSKIRMVVQTIQFLSKPAEQPEQRPADEFMPDADDDPNSIPF